MNGLVSLRRVGTRGGYPLGQARETQKWDTMVGDTGFFGFCFPQILQMGADQFTLLLPCFACLFVTQFNPHPASGHLLPSKGEGINCPGRAWPSGGFV